MNCISPKGVGKEAAGACAPVLSKVGWGHKWVCAPPTFGQTKYYNFAFIITFYS